MDFQRFIKAVSLLTVFTVALVFPFTSAVLATEDLNKENVLSVVEAKINEHVQLGKTEFQGIKPGKIIKIRDENNQITKFLVVLERDSQTAGYMIVDSLTNNIVEYALGDSHPGSNTPNELYYLGPLSFICGTSKR